MSANRCDIGRLYGVAGVRKNLVSVTFCAVCAPCCCCPNACCAGYDIGCCYNTLTRWYMPLVTVGSTGYFFSYRYQTLSTIYFILGILTTDLWSQGSLWFHVVKKVRYRELLNGGMSDPCQ